MGRNLRGGFGNDQLAFGKDAGMGSPSPRLLLQLPPVTFRLEPNLPWMTK